MNFPSKQGESILSCEVGTVLPSIGLLDQNNRDVFLERPEARMKLDIAFSLNRNKREGSGRTSPASDEICYYFRFTLSGKRRDSDLVASTRYVYDIATCNACAIADKLDFD